MEYKDMTVDALLRETRLYPGCVSAGEAAAELGRRLADTQATVEALQAIIKQMGEQAAVLAKDGVAAKAQLAQVQRERDEAIREHGKESGFWGRSCARLLDKRDELQAALDAEREKAANLMACQCDGCSETLEDHDAYCEKCWTRQQAALDAEREKVKELEQHVQDQSTSNLEIMRHTDDMQSRALDAERALAHLQALVRALPVESGLFLVQEADGDYYVDGNVRFCCRKDAHAYADLLRYRATLDATTPATCAHPGGELSQTGKCMRCTLPKGGDGEPAECTNHFTDGSKIFPSRNCCSKGAK